ncbi:hypothetical protein BaRGS_00018669 [Batillaria attramentaria]|uniref:Uncharacterized protein n=1 Tax=Batillaria attramentaria TaxID=370345 RepID=A0ABD0KSN1_9CAEN
MAADAEGLSRWVVVVALVTLQFSAVKAGGCPWERDGLKPWSDSATWGGTGVPGENAQVVIPDGVSVLLDVSPPRLASITIPAGSQLIWDNVDGLELYTGFIRVDGEFHLGRDTNRCRFKKKAHIVLTGRSDSDAKVEVQVDDDHTHVARKAIVVTSGGTLEIHGAEQLSWTKLAKTIPRADLDSPYQETTSGLHMMVWNEDGSAFDFNVFETTNVFDRIASYIAAVPDGKIVGVAVRNTIGDTSDTTLAWNNVYDAMGSLGSQIINTVGSAESYAFVAVKGQPSTAQEALETRIESGRVEGPYVSYIDWTRRLQFSVRSIIQENAHEAVFQVFNTDVQNPIIKLKDDVSSWNVGEQIVVASTDFDWRQAEMTTIMECSQCQPDEIRVTGPFRYTHYGEITYNVDERAEVALLSRSVLIEGELEDDCYSFTEREIEVCERYQKDTFGAHIQALHGHANFHVQHAELYHVGQQAHLGSYPLHFHMCDDASGSWVRNNSIHHSFSRCVTVHGTDYAEVSDNACYDHLGHGYFLEDSAEQNNVFRGNLGIGTQHGTLLLSDRKPEQCEEMELKRLFCDGLATFWITHPNNVFENNVAAGCDFGVMVEGRVSIGEEVKSVYAPENAFLQEADTFYDPREPNNENGEPRISYLERVTVYKNKDMDLWIRGGNYHIIQSTIADAKVGIYPAHSVPNTSVQIHNSIFVGETDNLGEPYFYRNNSDVYGDGPYPEYQFNRSFAKDPANSLTAVSFANGPVYMSNCFFDRFSDWYWNDDFIETWGYRPVRRGGALSFRRRNRYRSMPFNGVWDMKFGYCDNVNGGNWVLNRGEVEEWHMMDGNMQNSIRDYDGSVTGQAGTQIVRPYAVWTDQECVMHDNWKMVLFKAKTGVLETKGAKNYPVILRRDDIHDEPFTLRGDKNIEYMMMKNRSYTINFNGSIPTDLLVEGKANLEKYEYTHTTQIELRSSYFGIGQDSDINYVTNMADLDQDGTGKAIYWDKNTNMLFLKLMSNETREALEECAGSVCPSYTIDLLDGGVGPRDCSSHTWPPYDDGMPPPQTPPSPVCGAPDSPEGLGALDPEDVTPPGMIWPDCQQFPPLPTPAQGVYRGCYKDDKDQRDVPNVEQFLSSSMTVQLCLDRCKAFGYSIAALARGSECRCGNTYGSVRSLDESKCSKDCKGGDGNKATVQILSFVQTFSFVQVSSSCCPEAIRTGSAENVVGGRAAFGDPTEKTEQDDDVARRLQKAVTQLKRSGEVLDYIVKDIVPEMRVRKTVIVPYVARDQLLRILASRPTLKEGSTLKPSKERFTKLMTWIFAYKLQAALNAPSPLQYRDVLVLTRSADLHETTTDENNQEKTRASGVVRGLRSQDIPVGVLGWRRDDVDRWQKELDDLAVSKIDKVTVARWRAVDGLERKVVVYLPGRDTGVDGHQTLEEVDADDRLRLVSRASTQLIMVDVPRAS